MENYMLITVRPNVPAHPYHDEIIFAEGEHIFVVEKWRIDYYRELLPNLLPQSNKEASYYDQLNQMLSNPLFWICFSQEEKNDIVAKIVDPYSFKKYVENKEFSTDASFLTLQGRDENGGYIYRQHFVGEDSLSDALVKVLDEMEREDKMELMKDELGEEIMDSCCKFPIADIPFAEDDECEKPLVEQYSYHPTTNKICYETNTYNSFQEETPPIGAKRNLGELMDEFRKLAEELRARGIDQTAINDLLEETLTQHLIITRDLRVLLPDSRNIEVRMPPLDRSLYALFLNHPEGIRLDELGNHKAELMENYLRIMDYRPLPEIHRSINDLIDPNSNSAKEKCSRIRRAFQDTMGEDAAKPFIIKGRGNERRRISINRQNVTYEGK